VLQFLDEQPVQAAPDETEDVNPFELTVPNVENILSSSVLLQLGHTSPFSSMPDRINSSNFVAHFLQ